MPAAFQPLKTAISKSINTGADLLLEKLGQFCTGSSFPEDSLHNNPPAAPPRPFENIIMYAFLPSATFLQVQLFPRRHEQMTVLAEEIPARLMMTEWDGDQARLPNVAASRHFL